MTYSPETIPARKYAEKVLDVLGNEYAREFGVALTVALYPPTWQREVGPPRSFYERIKCRMRAAAESKKNDLDSECQIHVRQEVTPSFRLVVFTANDPLVKNKLLDGLREPLLRKISDQLIPARRQGLSVLLLLDQFDDCQVEMKSQWIFTLDTLRDALSEIFPTHGQPINEVWVRRPSGECVQIISPETALPVID